MTHQGSVKEETANSLPPPTDQHSPPQNVDDIVGIAASKHTIDSSTQTDAMPHQSPDAAQAPSTPETARPCESIPATSAETPPNEDKSEEEKAGKETFGRQLTRCDQHGRSRGYRVGCVESFGIELMSKVTESVDGGIKTEMPTRTVAVQEVHNLEYIYIYTMASAAS
jgi:hypothetical protein